MLRSVPDEDKSSFDRAFFILFAAVAALAILTFRDYGYSWDEQFQNRWYGQAVLRFFSSFGKDISATNKENFYLYGGTFDALAEFFVRITPLAPRNARHLANAIAGLAGILGTWKLGKLAGGSATGFWAALFLCVTAPFFGHMFINAKDIPFAAGYVWSLYFLAKILVKLPSPERKDLILFGVALGLTLGVRIGGVLVAFYALIFSALYLLATRNKTSPEIPTPGLVSLSRIIFAPLALAYLLMLAFWPAALLSPLSMPFEAIRAATKFNINKIVLWRGLWLDSVNLPKTYLPVVFGVELPEPLVIIMIPALIWALFALFIAARRRDVAVFWTLGLIFTAALFPPAWAIANSSPMYDNMRHFLFIIPPLYIIAAMSFTSFSAWAEGFLKLPKWLPCCVMVASLILPAARMLSLHPYEYAYKNAFAGGIPAASRRFDTDYWLTSYKEAATLLEKHARSVARATGKPFETSKFTVTVYGEEGFLSEDMPENFEQFRFGYADRTDYLIMTTRWRANEEWPDYPIVAVVERDGMAFAVVKAKPSLAELLPVGENP